MDKLKTLEVLENDFWGPPGFESHLAISCHKLRKVPLYKLTPENLRMLIGQEIGLQYLIPLALDILEDNLLVSGDMFEGDLLCCVAKVSRQFWDNHEELKVRAFDLSDAITSSIETLNEAESYFKGKLVW